MRLHDRLHGPRATRPDKQMRRRVLRETGLGRNALASSSTRCSGTSFPQDARTMRATLATRTYEVTRRRGTWSAPPRNSHSSLGASRVQHDAPHTTGDARRETQRTCRLTRLFQARCARALCSFGTARPLQPSDEHQLLLSTRWARSRTISLCRTPRAACVAAPSSSETTCQDTVCYASWC